MGSLQNLCKKTAQALDAYKLLSFLTQENACLDMESLHLQLKKLAQLKGQRLKV